MDIDLRTASYSEFLEFVFNHVPHDAVDDKWFWKSDPQVVADARNAVAHMTRMCQESEHLVQRFAMRQVAEGIDFVYGAGGAEWFRNELWNPEVPWVQRRTSILAIPELYTQLFEKHRDYGIGFMLWDWIAYGYFSGSRSPAGDAEDARVQDAMFEALARMLQSYHPDTQRAAIHGLGHLSHRNSNDTIRNFLSSSRAQDAEIRDYAIQVMEGNFQ